MLQDVENYKRYGLARNKELFVDILKYLFMYNSVYEKGAMIESISAWLFKQEVSDFTVGVSNQIQYLGECNKIYHQVSEMNYFS